jgi:antitoxin MazE
VVKVESVEHGREFSRALHQDAHIRQAFIHRVGAPVANKMYEACDAANATSRVVAPAGAPELTDPSGYANDIQPRRASMVQVTVGKWGDSLAVRLPGEVVQAAGLHDGERVDIEAQDGDIVIRPVEMGVVLEDLFRGKAPEEWRAEYAADAYDWGPDVGQEIIPE